MNNRKEFEACLKLSDWLALDLLFPLSMGKSIFNGGKFRSIYIARLGRRYE